MQIVPCHAAGIRKSASQPSKAGKNPLLSHRLKRIKADNVLINLWVYNPKECLLYGSSILSAVIRSYPQLSVAKIACKVFIG
jgi:hypothetical protein